MVYQTRSPFGVIRVNEDKQTHIETDSEGNEHEVVDYLKHTLLHGTTDHGNQRFDHGWREEPISYYFRPNKLSEVRISPLAAVFEKLIDPDVNKEIGVCGLGTGTTAAYAEKGQRITYFEIDPAVLDIDRATVNHNGFFRKIGVAVGSALGFDTTKLNREEKPRFHDPIPDKDHPDGEDLPLFTFLHDAEKDGVVVEVKMGDARQTLEQEDDAKYDLLVVDAFNSDAIPIHLLTKEAVELYFRKLQPDGVLMVHVSNRHLNLVPVVGNIAKQLAKDEYSDMQALWCNDVGTTRYERQMGKEASEWIALARTHKRLAPLLTIGPGEEDDSLWVEIPEYEKTVLWTDDYSNIIGVLDWWERMDVPNKATTPVKKETEAAAGD